MSSSYSPNLALELIGAGEQAGVWGTTTNTNLGTLVEQAISGYVPQSVSTGTDTTITIPQGASGVARNMFIELTGSGGALTNLIVPTNKKLYFIYNNTTTPAGQVTVKVSGQTGISVPAAAKVILVCNGTDIVVAENYLLNATLPSPTMTGTPVAPTATAGTNTTQVATTAFVQTNGTPAGSILMWGSATPPTNWLLCNTSTAISRTTYATLFAVIGTTYGVGDGSTTFNIPNFTNNMPIGAGGTYVAGSAGGSATTTIATANLPSHSHTQSGTFTSGGMSGSSSHTHNYYNSGGNGPDGYITRSYGNINSPSLATSNPLGSPASGIDYADISHTHTVTLSGSTGTAGSGTAVTTISPYLPVYFIIKYI
jgi:microcystin-dependent protein